jgi:hypothetical protein
MFHNPHRLNTLVFWEGLILYIRVSFHMNDQVSWTQPYIAHRGTLNVQTIIDSYR